MPNGMPYTDDGKPVGGVIRDGRGGKRPNAGRHPKPALTTAELLLVAQIRAKGNRRHGSSWERAAQVVSAGRVGSAIDPRTTKDRKVSAPWVARAFAEGIKMLNFSKSGPLDQMQTESEQTNGSGSRMTPYGLLEKPVEVARVQQTEETTPDTNQVVAKGGVA